MTQENKPDAVEEIRKEFGISDEKDKASEGIARDLTVNGSIAQATGRAEASPRHMEKQRFSPEKDRNGSEALSPRPANEKTVESQNTEDIERQAGTRTLNPSEKQKPLKTLEDYKPLEIRDKHLQNAMNRATDLLIENLREEARKWVKHLEKGFNGKIYIEEIKDDGGVSFGNWYSPERIIAEINRKIMTEDLMKEILRLEFTKGAITSFITFFNLKDYSKFGNVKPPFKKSAFHAIHEKEEER